MCIRDRGFDFSGTKSYDSKTGYHSKSFLTVPLKNHENEIIGVMQLINARDENGEVISFDNDMEEAAIHVGKTKIKNGSRILAELEEYANQVRESLRP